MKDFILGCDVSKNDVHVCLIDVSKDKVLGSRKFPNTTAGAVDLEDWMTNKTKGKEASVILEATGVYHENLVDVLYGLDVEVYVVNPKLIKHHIASHNRRYKNDKSDAYMIASFGLSIGTGINQVNITPWVPFSDFYSEIRAYSRQILTLQKSLAQFKNRKEALDSTARPPKEIRVKVQGIIDTIEDTIASCKEKLQDLIEHDAELKGKIEHITSAKGIGWLTAIHVISETDGFRSFTNARQVVAYAGLDVPDAQSGRCSKPGRISKCGSSHIRQALFMPSLSSGTREKGIFHEFYKGVYDRNGKKGTKAIVAVMRKMLCLIFTLWKKDEDYDPNYVWKPTNKKSDFQEAGASFVQNPMEIQEKEETLMPPL